MGFINPRSGVRSSLLLYIKLVLILKFTFKLMSKKINKAPGEAKAKKKESDMVIADIRRMKHSKPNPVVSIIITIVVILMFMFVWSSVSNFLSKGEEVSLSEAINDIADKKYDKISIKESSVILEIEVEQEVRGEVVKVPERKHATFHPNTDFYSLLSDSGVDIKELENDYFEPTVQIGFFDIVSVIFLGLIIFFIYSLFKNMQSSGGKLLDFGQSKAKLLFGKKTGIKFTDVAGIDDVKEELVEVVDFLKNPKKFRAIGARIPKGVLLVGAPGTGKTLLAKAVAGEAGVPFFHTSGSEFEEMLVGAGASRVRDLFTKAKKTSPSIIFIDEIDAVAKKRGTVLHSGTGEQTLNQVLVEMDGLEERQDVIVLAATNRPDVLDPAILRPGRFDRTVTISLPDYQGRREIIEVHAKNKKFTRDIDLDSVAKRTIGYSGADLENLLNESAIIAVKEGRKEIVQEDLSEAFLKVSVGRKKKSKLTQEDIYRVAYHEAGHAIVSKFTKDADPVEQISIVSRGSSGGVTLQLPRDDSRFLKKSEILAKMNVLVSGKVAEEIFTNDVSTGPASDLRVLTELAKGYVKRFGMSEKLGFVQYGDMEETSHLGYMYGGGSDYSQETAKLIDAEIKRLVDGAIKNAREIILKHREKVEELVKVLLEKEVVTGEEFEELFK
jgi:cell division protease FtsH